MVLQVAMLQREVKRMGNLKFTLEAMCMWEAAALSMVLMVVQYLLQEKDQELLMTLKVV